MRNKGSRKIRPARIGETAMTHHCSRKTLQRETELEPTGADDGLCPNIFSEYNQQGATYQTNTATYCYVAPYWLYSGNILAMHGPMNVKVQTDVTEIWYGV